MHAQNCYADGVTGCNKPRRQGDSKPSMSAVVISTHRSSWCLSDGYWKSYVSVDWCCHLWPVLSPSSQLCVLSEHAGDHGTLCCHFCLTYACYVGSVEHSLYFCFFCVFYYETQVRLFSLVLYCFSGCCQYDNTSLTIIFFLCLTLLMNIFDCEDHCRQNVSQYNGTVDFT